MSRIEYGVSLSPSGLLINIESVENGKPSGSMQIQRRSWPAVVDAVAQAVMESQVRADVEVALGEADEDRED